MKKTIITLLALFFTISLTSFSQDIMYKKDGSKVEVKVLEINNKKAAITGKLNKKNAYRIEVRNKMATYYINDIEIGNFDLNANLSKACFIGFLVKDKQKVFFDELEILEP